MMELAIPLAQNGGVSYPDSRERKRPDAAFGARLRAARDRADLSQEQVAEKLDVSFQTVSNWETGYRVPGAGHLFSLASLYGEAPEWLLRGVRPSTPEELARDPEWIAAGEDVLRLPPDRRAAAVRAFRALLRAGLD
jgi:transcriptional regulator with XRE-family HTH domain